MLFILSHNYSDSKRLAPHVAPHFAPLFPCLVWMEHNGISPVAWSFLWRRIEMPEDILDSAPGSGLE